MGTFLAEADPPSGMAWMGCTRKRATALQEGMGLTVRKHDSEGGAYSSKDKA